MRCRVAARALLTLGLLLLGCRAGAQAQGTVSEQPLPPPPGTAPLPPSPLSPIRPILPRPVPHHVPVVRPPHAAVKKPASSKSGNGTSTATRPTKTAAKHPAPKPVAKPAAPVPTPKPAAPPSPKIDPTKGTATGLPLPRWAAFRSDDVNLRSGPGMQYPIEWVYHRRDLPVQILREFEIWRLIEEADGTKGWVHEATLTGRRGFVVQGGDQVLRAGPAETADAVAQVEPGVVGHIRQCPSGSDWCDVQAGAYHGWLKRSALYGISPGEAIQ